MPFADHSSIDPAAMEPPEIEHEAEGSSTWLNRLWPGGLSDLAIAIPAAVSLVVLVYWAGDRGGFDKTVWYPGALIALWLLAICVFDRRYSLRLRECRTASLAFFVLFTVWSFLSITWATVKGDAWDGANQTLLYLTVFAIFSRWRMNTRIAGLFASLYAIAVAAIGLLTIERALHGGDPASIMFASRLASPIDYPNGEAALFLIPLWPVLFLAARREVPPLARGLLAACGSLLLQLAVLAQSRGSMYAFPIVFLLFLVFVSGRGRTLVTAMAVIAVSSLNLGRLLSVYEAGQRSNRDLARALTEARNGMILPLVLVFALVALVASVEGRVSLAERSARRLDRGVVAGFGVVLVLTAVIAVGAVGHPLRRVENAWGNFTTGAGAATGSSHFASLYGTHRYDFWRVSTNTFLAHPLEGVGAGNFAVEYLVARRSSEEPNNPHSLEMKVLVQTGAVGSLLFLAFLASALVAARQKPVTRRRPVDPLGRGLAGSLVVAFFYWFVHGSVDWFWELPALAAVAFAFLGLAVALSAGDQGGEQRSVRDRYKALLVVPVALVVTISYTGPWLSARYVDAASRNWRIDPTLAFDQLDRARSLDPLSDSPDLIAGTIAGRRNDYSQMTFFYTRALERNDSDWYAWLELGMAEYLSRNRSEALHDLERAVALNPRETVVRLVQRRVRNRGKVDLAAINRIFLERALSLALGSS
jgi:O-antigen ligase